MGAAAGLDGPDVGAGEGPGGLPAHSFGGVEVSGRWCREGGRVV